MNIRDRQRTSLYQFGTSTADLYICTSCGAVAAAVSEIDGQLRAVVNVNTFAEGTQLRLQHGTTDFDGEDLESRLARRGRNWIPRVTIIG